MTLPVQMDMSITPSQMCIDQAVSGVQVPQELRTRTPLLTSSLKLQPCS